MKRRTFLQSFAFGAAATSHARERTYHVCLSPDALDADPDLLKVVQAAGVNAVWLPGFFYGYWPYSLDRIQTWRRRIEKLGMEAHVANVPLGHPGDSLGAMHGEVPLTPPRRWKMGVAADGRSFSGTSLHPPAVEENRAALRRLAGAGVRRVFLDDDFRLARSPGTIGGCFCDAHIQSFARRYGYSPAVKQELLDAVRGRNLTAVLRNWIGYQCDELTAAFRAIQAAAPQVRLGIMVMYLGAEKAGIRLADYRDVPFRVGELMFDDRSFAPVKGKTDELFSALFHRRFARPELAFSETTAFPSDKLSARNMAAKLAVSTLADVRNTMFMSGLTPFPRSHWETLGPAMRKQAAIHRRIAGHVPQGPFQHCWDEHSRMVGEDKPQSLFLASGIPFEVSPAPAATALPESLAGLYRWKRAMASKLHDIPYVEDDKPVVCAWYPGAHSVLLWNLSEGPETFSLVYRGSGRRVSVSGLDTELLVL
jgi:hypothetical protein